MRCISELDFAAKQIIKYFKKRKLVIKGRRIEIYSENTLSFIIYKERLKVNFWRHFWPSFLGNI